MPFCIQSFDIIIGIPDSDIVISGLDIEFKVKKSINSDADSVEIIIWNLDEDTYKKLIQKDQPIYLYTKTGNAEVKLLFIGFLDKTHIKRRRMVVTKTNNEAAPPDIVTVLNLIESRLAYDNTYINENYREPVSAEQIINDCISAMGLGSVIIDSQIPEKIYSTFKAIGKPHCILKEICDSVGLDVVIQNGIIHIGSLKNDNSEDDIPIFSLANSLEPQYQSNNEVLLITQLRCDIYPNQLIKCDYEELRGVYKVVEVNSEGNNFDMASTTYITIGLE